jgi:hypothetical protein
MLTVSFARVKPGMEARLRAWLAELSSRQAEARRSLEQEGTRQEQYYVLPTADGPVLVYAMEANDVKQAYASYGHSTLEIDDEHRAVLAEVLAEPLQIEPSYDCSIAPSRLS